MQKEWAENTGSRQSQKRYLMYGKVDSRKCSEEFDFYKILNKGFFQLKIIKATAEIHNTPYTMPSN